MMLDGVIAFFDWLWGHPRMTDAMFLALLVLVINLLARRVKSS